MQSCVLQRMLSRGVGSWRHAAAAAAALLVPLRHLTRDIGQPTHHSHPHLLAEGESEWIYPHQLTRVQGSLMKLLSFTLLQFYPECTSQNLQHEEQS